jgi:hypothetical protein
LITWFEFIALCVYLLPNENKKAPEGAILQNNNIKETLFCKSKNSTIIWLHEPPIKKIKH